MGNLTIKLEAIRYEPKFSKYYQSESRFNGVYSRDNLPNKIKDEAYVINLDEYFDIGTHWVALYVKNNDVTCIDSFGVEHIPNYWSYKLNCEYF